VNSDTGEIQNFESHEEALKAGFDVPVDLKDLTPDQADRFIKNQQPVIKLKDVRSKIGKLRLQASKARNKGSNYTTGKKKRRKRK